MKEKWKPLAYPFDRFSISNFGRVRRNRDGRIMKCGKSSKSGYQYAVFRCYRDGRRYSLYLAACVHEKFATIPHIKGAKMIYIDGNTLNCRIDNLRMCRGYEVAPSEFQVKTYREDCLRCIKHYLKARAILNLQRDGFDCDELIGESAFMIWKHLSQFGEHSSFYVFCRKYIDLCFKKQYKEWKIRRSFEKSLSDLYRTGVLC